MKHSYCLMILLYALTPLAATRADDHTGKALNPIRAKATAEKGNPALARLGIRRLVQVIPDGGETVSFSSALEICLRKKMVLPSVSDLAFLVPHYKPLFGESFDTDRGYVWASDRNPDPKYPRGIYSFDAHTEGKARLNAKGRVLCAEYEPGKMPGPAQYPSAMLAEMIRDYRRPLPPRTDREDMAIRTERKFRKLYPVLKPEEKTAVLAAFTHFLLQDPEYVQTWNRLHAGLKMNNTPVQQINGIQIGGGVTFDATPALQLEREGS